MWDAWDDAEDCDDDGHLHGDLAALDFLAIDEQQPQADGSSENPAAPESEQPEEASPLFTVTNPSGSVAVTTAINGCVHHVELAPKVTNMTEGELAQEIRVIADLARLKALSVTHAFLVEGLGGIGYDPSAISASLSHGLCMPTPEQADEAAAHEFARRYGGDPDW
ncbi:DUF2694 family protein [Mycobacterium kyorinense]|uniref:Secretion protein EspD n=1 Tax=Mycobacterium kyorinense TaxID=487514 RepID=A0A1X1XSK0_9MYCO|nr:DUF2694 family protein [Mycobacterium kyorinense]ORW01734.1 hypothetical protein AWC14_07935 [Mycobacterium kyorinense]